MNWVLTAKWGFSLMHEKLYVLEIKMVDNHFLSCTKISSYGGPGIFSHGKCQFVSAYLVWMKIGLAGINCQNQTHML